MGADAHKKHKKALKRRTEFCRKEAQKTQKWGGGLIYFCLHLSAKALGSDVAEKRGQKNERRGGFTKRHEGWPQRGDRLHRAAA